MAPARRVSWSPPRRIPREIGGDGRFVRPRRDFVPAYLSAFESGRLREKVEEAIDALRSCTLCPRDCEVDRLANRFAVCKTGRHARVSSHFPHHGEEDVLRGDAGSGTIFFAKVPERHPELNREVTFEEFETALAHARAAGLWRLDRRWRRLADRVFAG